MRKTFFTVGPSQIYPTVPIHIESAVKNDILSISHRGLIFKDIYKEVIDGIRKLLNVPENYEIVLLSSATEAMERILQSMSHNNSFHILTGFFGLNWMGLSKDLGKSPQYFQFFDWDIDSDPAIKQLSYQAKKKSILKNNFEKMSEARAGALKIPAECELVCITQNDTSVGFSIPMDQIYKLKKKYPEKLFALDVVSSVPYVDIEYKYLDSVFFSVQKGFGLPAGLAVLILSPNAIKQTQKLSKKGYSIGSFHNLLKLVENSKKFQTFETPNVLGIYLLAQVLKDFLKIGINKIRKETDIKAQMIYSFFSEPESSKDIQDVVGTPFIKDLQYQSVTTPVFEIVKGSEGLIKFAAEKGLILGAGYKSSLPAGAGKDFKDKHIRIANFPAQSKDDITQLIRVLNKFNLK